MLHDSQIPRSCDRCYAHKEKCRWHADGTKCERCSRVGHVCETKRPLRRPGRRSRTAALAKSPVVTLAETPESLDPSIWRGALSTLPDLSSRELTSLHRAIHHDDFIQQFVLGPSFCESHRQRLAFHLLSSRSVVLDAYLACALSFESAGGYSHAAQALTTLRSLRVQNKLDVSTCLILGWQILHFVLKVGGSELLDICRHTLSLIEPYYDAVEGGYSSFLTSLVLTDTAESLLITGRPTLRMPPAAEHIDGCVGVCVTILPHLHDLAILNADYCDGEGCKERLDTVEETIRSWKPSVPADFCAVYTATEVSHMMCQAHVIQTAALLIIHRIRHPFGSEDATAAVMSSSILMQLDMTRIITGKVPRSVDLPLIVASIEIASDEERTQRLQEYSSIGTYSHMFHERIKTLLNRVWDARRKVPSMYWYNIGEVLAHSS